MTLQASRNPRALPYERRSPLPLSVVDQLLVRIRSRQQAARSRVGDSDGDAALPHSRPFLAHLIRTDASATEIKWAARTAHEFAVALENTLAARKEREKAVAPTLGREQIAELNKYADTLPFFSTDRKEFKEATRIAKVNLLRMETPEAARKQVDQLRVQDFSARTIEQPSTHTTSNTDRSDRDSYSRGR